MNKLTKKKARIPRIKPLEKLLEIGDSETYGQVCWYLANRDFKRHQAGDVIKLDMWKKAGVK